MVTTWVKVSRCSDAVYLGDGALTQVVNRGRIISMEALEVPIADPLEVAGPKPGTFQKGHDPRRGGNKKPPKEYIAPEEDGASLHLMDMRHVYLNTGSFDKTQGQETARQLLRKDPKGFMSQLAALEKEHRANVRAVAGGADAVDVGGEAALGLCESWLKERA